MGFNCCASSCEYTSAQESWADEGNHPWLDSDFLLLRFEKYPIDPLTAYDFQYHLTGIGTFGHYSMLILSFIDILIILFISSNTILYYYCTIVYYTVLYCTILNYTLGNPIMIICNGGSRELGRHNPINYHSV